MKHGRILMFKVKSVCYGSTFYLADLYGKAFEELGYEVEYFSTDKEPLDALERYAGASFDAMIDFNSLLPNLETEDGELFLNQIQAPFYNYILDHPLYHNKQLKAELKQYHVICLDDTHGEYVQKYYPYIQSVTVLPLCGLPIQGIMGDEKAEDGLHTGMVTNQIVAAGGTSDCRLKKFDILFSGTYADSNDFYGKICSFEEPFAGDMKEIIEILQSKTTLTIEAATKIMLDRRGMELPDGLFKDYLYAGFLVDMFIKAYYREQVLEQILKTGRTITVYGGNWEKWNHFNSKQLDVRQMVPFGQMPEVVSRAYLSVNCMPWFKAGVHDRIFTAMRGATVSFTDSSQMLDGMEEITKDSFLYDLEKLNEIPDLMEQALADKNQLVDMGNRLQLVANARHSVQKRVESLIREMRKLL